MDENNKTCVSMQKVSVVVFRHSGGLFESLRIFATPELAQAAYMEFWAKEGFTNEATIGDELKSRLDNDGDTAEWWEEEIETGTDEPTVESVEFAYMYRDGDNYKTHSDLDAVFANPDGIDVNEAWKRMQAAAESGEFFIAHQVSLRNLFHDNGNDDAAHCHHEMVAPEPTGAEPTDARTLRQFVDQFCSTEWEEFDRAEAQQPVTVQLECDECGWRGQTTYYAGGPGFGYVCPECESTASVIDDTYVITRAVGGLFWSNESGWGDLASADRCNAEEKEHHNLPAGGLWMSLKDAQQEAATIHWLRCDAANPSCGWEGTSAEAGQDGDEWTCPKCGGSEKLRDLGVLPGSVLKYAHVRRGVFYETEATWKPAIEQLSVAIVENDAHRIIVRAALAAVHRLPIRVIAEYPEVVRALQETNRLGSQGWDIILNDPDCLSLCEQMQEIWECGVHTDQPETCPMTPGDFLAWFEAEASLETELSEEPDRVITAEARQDAKEGAEALYTFARRLRDAGVIPSRLPWESDEEEQEEKAKPSLVLLDVNGDGSCLYLVQDNGTLEQTLEAWRIQDQAYIEGKIGESEWLSVPAWLKKHSHRPIPYRAIRL